jgi:hypothetical protein
MIPLKKGMRVEFNYLGEHLFGTVDKGGSKSVKVIIDGGEKVVSGPALSFKVSNTPLPKDPPSVMDKYSIIGYKAHNDMSDETTCFSAKICLNGKPIISVSNEGCGGPHNFHPLVGTYAGIDKFLEDAKAWCEQFGYKDPMEPGDFWVDWYTGSRPYAITAAKYVKDFAEHIASIKS